MVLTFLNTDLEHFRGIGSLGKTSHKPTENFICKKSLAYLIVWKEGTLPVDDAVEGP